MDDTDKIKNDQRKTLNTLLKLDEDQLLEELGGVLAKQQSLGLSAPNSKRKREIGRTWLKSRSSKFSELICQDQRVKILMKSETADRRIELAAVVADLLAASFTSLPIFTVTALLIKNGIHELCKENDEKI